MEGESKRYNWFTMFWEGFKNMSTLGKTLWTLVIIKLIIMFIILRPFFFPNYIKSNFDTKEKRENYLRNELIDRSK